MMISNHLRVNESFSARRRKLVVVLSSQVKHKIEYMFRSVFLIGWLGIFDDAGNNGVQKKILTRNA